MQRISKMAFALFFLAPLLPCPPRQVHAGELTAGEIVTRANHAACYQGTDSKGTVSMTIRDRQGRLRRRSFNILRRDDSDTDGNQKYYAFFHAPADVRKMVFMVHKHTTAGVDDDRWLYLPGLDLVKRIAAGDKRTSFAGSDFLYEDISGRDPAADRHELLRTTDTYYVIQSSPRAPESVEFSHYLSYIDRQTFLPMRMEFYKQHNSIYRIIEARKVELITAVANGKNVSYPTITLSVARDIETQSESEIAFTNVSYNNEIRESIFSERYLRNPPRHAIR